MEIMKKRTDFLVLGSGIAGLTFALKASEYGKVMVITKSKLDDTNTKYAQGGIASVFREPDNFEKHISDTLIAGAGLCDESVVRMVVNEAPERIKDLIALGVPFDKKGDGTYDLAREGGHSEYRILHHKDKTGDAIEKTLIEKIKDNPDIEIYENHFAIEVLTQHHLGVEVKRNFPGIKCYGAYVADLVNQKIITFLSKITVVATGGMGHVYLTTTNPEIATGDGIAMVYRAKGTIENMEFVQFHPTAFYTPEYSGNRFLISEAVRGEGGILLNKNNERFMHKYNEMGEIAPRDIVSRAIFSEMKKTNSEYVYLDITHKDSDYLKKRFPTIYRSCLEHGVDITKDYIPVSPVQHYFMGGIRTDLMGRTNIKGLHACGEAANTGVHGANRLASNSLLEGLVFGRRSAEYINAGIKDIKLEEVHVSNVYGASGKTLNVMDIRNEIKTLMDAHAGIERNGPDMEKSLNRINEIIGSLEDAEMGSVSAMETLNIAYIASLILKGAIARKKNCGSHYRTDSE